MMIDINFGDTTERDLSVPDVIEIRAVPDSEDWSDDLMEMEAKKLRRKYQTEYQKRYRQRPGWRERNNEYCRRYRARKRIQEGRYEG